MCGLVVQCFSPFLQLVCLRYLSLCDPFCFPCPALGLRCAPHDDGRALNAADPGPTAHRGRTTPGGVIVAPPLSNPGVTAG